MVASPLGDCKATSVLDTVLVAMLLVLWPVLLSQVPFQESPPSEESHLTYGPISLPNHC